MLPDLWHQRRSQWIHLVLLGARSEAYLPDLQVDEALDLGLISSALLVTELTLTSQHTPAQLFGVHAGTRLHFLGLREALGVSQLSLPTNRRATHSTYFHIKSDPGGRSHMPSTTVREKIGTEIPNGKKNFFLNSKRKEEGNPSHSQCVCRLRPMTQGLPYSCLSAKFR